MSLLKLDEILTQVAAILYQAFPGQDWKEIHYVLRMSPDTKNDIYDYYLVTIDGSIDKVTSLDVKFRLQINDLLVQHQHITEEMGLPWWFEFRMTVFSDGRFKADFGYRDSYRPEDLTL